jgi:hypothetical protein
MKTTVCPVVGGFATSSDQIGLAKGVALLRLRMHPPGGHVIILLPGFLPDETSIPETTLPSLPLLPILPDLDVRYGCQYARSISHRPLHFIMCASYLPHHSQTREARNSRLTAALIPISNGDIAFLLYTCSCRLKSERELVRMAQELL